MKICTLELGTRSNLRMRPSHGAKGKCSLVGGLPSTGMLASQGGWLCPFSRDRSCFAEQQFKLFNGNQRVMFMQEIWTTQVPLGFKTQWWEQILCCHIWILLSWQPHVREHPVAQGKHGEGSAWCYPSESVQRVTWGHQTRPFCGSKVLVSLGKTQFVSRSECHGTADVGDMGGVRQGVGSWKATKRWMSFEHQHEHRTSSLPMRVMPSSGWWCPALWTLLPHHWLDNPMLPMLHCVIRDWDPCSRVLSCKRGGGLDQGKQGTSSPWDVKDL